MNRVESCTAIIHQHTALLEVHMHAAKFKCTCWNAKLTLYSGCGQCWTVDGNWKLTFPHCMFPVKNSVLDLPGLSFLSTCPEQPEGKKAFCAAHCVVAKEHGCPTDICGYVKYQKSTGIFCTCPATKCLYSNMPAY